MGSLHKGHASLLKQAKTLPGKVMASIFVNPTQFAQDEDLGEYPRDLKRDLDILDELAINSVFIPTAKEIYPLGFQTYCYNSEIAKSLCGSSRPEHFTGVCTIVIKLLNMIQPDNIIFGKKDFQQWKIIEHMVKDLNVNTNVIGCEMLRDVDGLALSSRNQNLSKQERIQALALFHGLRKTRQAFHAGLRDADQLLQIGKEHIESHPLVTLDYLDIRSERSLDPAPDLSKEKSIVLGAIKIGKVRLIDNIVL